MTSKVKLCCVEFAMLPSLLYYLGMKRSKSGINKEPQINEVVHS